jgi:hypothetical protein
MEPRILRVGRGERDRENRTNDIQVNHSSVSRSHLEVFIDPQNNVFITDLATSNGTFVNGNPVVDTILLKDGDILKLGSARPVHWKKWIVGDFMENNDQTDSSAMKKSNDSDNQERLMMTTAGQSQKKQKSAIILIFLIVIVIISLIFMAFVFYSDSTQASPSRRENRTYARVDLESKDYAELQQLISLKVKVSGMSSGDWIDTKDGKRVKTIIENNLLTGISLNESIEVSEKVEIDTAHNLLQIVDMILKKDNSMNDPDGDHIDNIHDDCDNLACTISNKGCPLNHYVYNINSDGSFEVKVLKTGESINQFRSRILSMSNLRCSYPSSESEIINQNGSVLNDDEKKFGTQPAITWIKFI